LTPKGPKEVRKKVGIILWDMIFFPSGNIGSGKPLFMDGRWIPAAAELGLGASANGHLETHWKSDPPQA